MMMHDRSEGCSQQWRSVFAPPPSRLKGRILNKMGLAWVSVFALSQFGCSTADVVGAHVLKQVLKPDPTVVEATIRVAKDVNPDMRDRPSPIKVRFYLLSSSNVLQSANFFELKDQDRELLSNDLRLREERVFRPGAEESLELRIPAEDADEDERVFLGVIAGYWELDDAQWRAVEEIEVRETTAVRIDIGRAAVTIKVVDN
jgi:type VI secretion system protein VasD